MNAEKLPTLPPTTISQPFIEMPQRRRRIAVDDEQSAMSPKRPPRPTRSLRRRTRARHHVLGHARAGVAVHVDASRA